MLVAPTSVATVLPAGAVTVQTADRGLAQVWLAEAWSRGLEGVVAKQASLRHRGGQRALVKVKAYETADVGVGGYTGPQDVPRGLLRGAFDGRVRCTTSAPRTRFRTGIGRS